MRRKAFDVMPGRVETLLGIERAGRKRLFAASPHRDFIIRRILKIPVILLLVSVLVFALSRFGGSPIGIYLRYDMSEEQVQALYEKYNLNDSFIEQYLAWLGGVLQGDWGWSGVAAAPVLDVLPEKLAVTFELGILAGILSIILGIAFGTFGGARHNRLGDHITRVVSSMGASLPAFWFALVALYVLYLKLGWAPLGRSTDSIYASISHPTGMYTVDAVLNGSWPAFYDAISHLWLPVLILAFTGMAEISRFMRSSLITELSADYVDAARAKGVGERPVLRRHARRNALIPTITMAGIAFAGIIQGAVVIELIFQYPGMGRWITDAVLEGDRATIMGFVMVSAVVLAFVNLGVDLAYAHFDRRITLGASDA